MIICDVVGPDSSVIHRGWTLGHQNMSTIIITFWKPLWKLRCACVKLIWITISPRIHVPRNIVITNVCSEWSKSIKEKNDCRWGKNRVCTFGHHISPMAVSFFWLICFNQKKKWLPLGKNRVCTFGHQVGFNVNSQRVCFTPNRQWTSCTYFDVRVCKPYEFPNGNRFFFDSVCPFFTNYFKRNNFQGSFSVPPPKFVTFFNFLSFYVFILAHMMKEKT